MSPSYTFHHSYIPCSMEIHSLILFVAPQNVRITTQSPFDLSGSNVDMFRRVPCHPIPLSSSAFSKIPRKCMRPDPNYCQPLLTYPGVRCPSHRSRTSMAKLHGLWRGHNGTFQLSLIYQQFPSSHRQPGSTIRF